MTNIIVVSLDLRDCRRFTRVKHLSQWMNAQKLFPTYTGTGDGAEEDRRFLVDPTGQRKFKVFEYANDFHVTEKSFRKNTKALPSFFDDWEEVHLKGRK